MAPGVCFAPFEHEFECDWWLIPNRATVIPYEDVFIL